MSLINLTNENLNEILGEGIVIVDFYAPWCGPCKMLGPIIDAFANERDDVTIIKVDIDKNPEIAEEYSVMSIPTLILFKNKEKASTKQGFQSKEMLMGWIDENK